MIAPTDLEPGVVYRVNARSFDVGVFVRVESVPWRREPDDRMGVFIGLREEFGSLRLSAEYGIALAPLGRVGPEVVVYESSPSLRRSLGQFARR